MKEVILIEKSKENDRNRRIRAQNHSKNVGIILQEKESETATITQEYGAFGREWARVEKGSASACTSLGEVMEGIIAWHFIQI